MSDSRSLESLKSRLLNLLDSDSEFKSMVQNLLSDTLASKSEMLSVLRAIDRRLENMAKQLEGTASKVEGVQFQVHEEFKALRKLVQKEKAP